MIQNSDIYLNVNTNSYYSNSKKQGFWRNILFSILRLICLLLISSFLIFFLIDVSPVDPLTSNIGQRSIASMSPEKITQLNEYWRESAPLFERYLAWLKSALTGDFGVSIYYGEDVSSILLTRGSTSLFLLASSWVLSAILGYILGVIAGLYKGKLVDKIISGYCWIFVATPQYWVALIAILIFSVNWGLFPVGFSQDIGSVGQADLSEFVLHATLPCLVLTITSMSNYCLHTRTKTIEVLNSDYVKFEKSLNKSHSEITFKHVLKNVNLPAISIAFTQIGEIIGGSIVVETVFSYPGLGNAIVNAAIRSDANLLAGITIIMCFIVFVGNTISQIISDNRS